MSRFPHFIIALALVSAHSAGCQEEPGFEYSSASGPLAEVRLPEGVRITSITEEPKRITMHGNWEDALLTIMVVHPESPAAASGVPAKYDKAKYTNPYGIDFVIGHSSEHQGFIAASKRFNLLVIGEFNWDQFRIKDVLDGIDPLRAGSNEQEGRPDQIDFEENVTDMD